MAAARAISDATEKLFEAEGVGEIRDNIRAYKRELGSRILHPSVLSAAVRYNVAMSNRVTGLVEGGLTIDRLADDLFASRARLSEAPAAYDLDIRLRAASSGSSPRSSCACSKSPRPTAWRRRSLPAWKLPGWVPPTSSLSRCAATITAAFLMRAAVTLGLIIRHEPRIGPDLRQLGIDPALLAGDWLHELAREMTATAHKLMAEAQYAEASRLSEMKVKHLAVASTTPEHRGGRARPRNISTVRSRWCLRRASASKGRGCGRCSSALGLLVFALLLSPLRGGEDAATGDLSELSPYLQSGIRADDGGSTRFVGTLSGSLGAPRRERAALRRLPDRRTG